MTINLTAKDIGKQYRITATAMIDRSGLEVTNQPAIFRGPTERGLWMLFYDFDWRDFDFDWRDASAYIFDLPVDLLKLALPEHVMEFLDEEFRSKEQPDTHRRVHFFIEDIDSIESEPEITLQSL